MVFGGLVFIEERRIALLQEGAVPQDDPGDGGGGIGGHDRPVESLPHQPWQVAGVIQMRLGHDDGIDTGGLDRQWRPVQLAKVPHPLEQATVQQDSTAARLQEVFGAGDRAGRAQAAQRERLPLNGIHTPCLAA